MKETRDHHEEIGALLLLLPLLWRPLGTVISTQIEILKKKGKPQ